MDYNIKTQELIDRMCRNAERKDFKLKKKNAENYIMQTYDLFNLPRPKKVVWCKDVFEKKFETSARSARSAGSAWSTRSTQSAQSARSAWYAGPARSARSARSAWSAGSVRSARYVGYTGSAGSLEWTALDYDFNLFVFEFEYSLNPDEDKKPNENDKKYLEYSQLLMSAIECGLGYFVEWKGVIYLAPTPIVKIDDRNRFHSVKEPAIAWKGGKEFYYLHGVNFEKKWWKKIVNDEMSPEEIFAIDNLEHRRIAYEFMDKIKMRQLKNYKILDEQTDDQGNPMKIISFVVKDVKEPLKYYNCFCPSTQREYFLGTDKEKCWDAKLSSFGIDVKFDTEY